MLVKIRTNKTAQLFIGLGLGIFFGFFLQRSGVTHYDTILNQLLLTDFTVVKVMLTAIIVGTIVAPSLPLMYLGGITIGLATGVFMTTNWALGTDLAPPEEAGRYLGVSNLAGAGAGVVGAGVGGPLADYLNGYRPGLGYFVVFGCYGLLFLLSAVSLIGVRSASTRGRGG